MQNLYVHQHTRLGDMILCNALIRILSKKNIKKKINLFCRSKHRNLIKYMYRDNKKINLIGINEDPELTNEKLLMKYEAKFIENYLKKKLIKKKDFITIGFDNYEKTKNLNLDKKHPWPCEVVFYKQFNIPFTKRFTGSYWKRDSLEEKRIFNKNVKKNEKYIFVHDDPKRNIYLKNLNKNSKIKKIVRNDINENIFNYALLLENANEIHIMESSIRQILEVLKLKTNKLFLYKGRGGEHDVDLYNSKLKKFVGTSKKWQIVNDGITSIKKTNILNKLKNKILKSNQKLIYLRSVSNLI
jgi:hypothetical protein